MNKHLLIYAIIIIIVQIIIISDLLNKASSPPVINETVLTNTDTIYLEIDSLKNKSDTIKLYYERKTSNYHILPRSERIKLFSDRINR